MGSLTLEQIRKKYTTTKKAETERMTAMAQGVKHAQDGYVKTVANAARRAKTSDLAKAQNAMAKEVGGTSMLAGPAANGGPDHALSRTLPEIAFYPEHNARKESAQYAKVHHELVVNQQLPCLSCGVTQATLGNPKKNPYGAKALETHHHVVEWALANALDVNKFNEKILPALAHRHPNNAQYKKAFTEQQMLDWVDHDPDNLWVLCDVHHRHVYLGIHAITDPIWGPVDILRDNFLTEGFMMLSKGVIPNIKGARGRTTAKKATKKKKAAKPTRKKKRA